MVEASLTQAGSHPRRAISTGDNLSPTDYLPCPGALSGFSSPSRRFGGPFAGEHTVRHSGSAWAGSKLIDKTLDTFRSEPVQGHLVGRAAPSAERLQQAQFDQLC